MTPKKISTYLMKKVTAEVELQMLQEQMEPYMDMVLLAIVHQTHIDQDYVKEMDAKGVRINELRTEINFCEEQLLDSGLFNFADETIDKELPNFRFNLN